LREVPNAILYLAAERLPLRGLLAGVPPRSTVYGYFRRLWQLGIWTRICMAPMMAAREQAGKQASPTAAIVDSQSVKTTEFGGLKSFDAGKKIMGHKRHLLSDALGLTPVLIAHAADIQDRGGLAHVRVRRRFPWQAMVSADAGYQYDQAACAAAQQRRRLEVVRRPRDDEGFHLSPKRWVIE
jgi:putative transposase